MATYTIGQYKLGEKYMFYVLGNSISSYRSVPDAKVQEAQSYFTKAYAVRITTIEDLDALHAYPNTEESIDASISNYYKRPEKQDISRAAVERAVKIARWYTPYNNNRGSWTEAAFAALPYIAVPPAVEFGQPPPTVIATQTIENVTPVSGTDIPVTPVPIPVKPVPPTQTVVENKAPVSNTEQPGTAPVTEQPTTTTGTDGVSQVGDGSVTDHDSQGNKQQAGLKKYWWIPVGLVIIIGGYLYFRKKAVH